MQAIAVHQEPSALVLGMPTLNPKLYADKTGIDHPTPPAPDRGKPAKKTSKKKKKR